MKPDVIRALNRELVLLAEVSDRWKIPTAHIAERLIAWEAQPLPDVLPPPPEWVGFKWPKSGEVNLLNYWREVDRKGKIDWSGPYL